MSEELEKRLCSTGHRTDIELEAAAELKAGRERIEAMRQRTTDDISRMQRRLEQAEATIAQMLVDNGRLTEQCREWESAHTKALADVERLQARFDELVRVISSSRKAIMGERGNVHLPQISVEWLDGIIKQAALKETSGEQDGS